MGKKFGLADLPETIPVFPLPGALLLPRARLPRDRPKRGFHCKSVLCRRNWCRGDGQTSAPWYRADHRAARLETAGSRSLPVDNARAKGKLEAIRRRGASRNSWPPPGGLKVAGSRRMSDEGRPPFRPAIK